MSSLLASVFESIYTQKHWNTGSGPGSNPKNIIVYRAFLEQFMRSNAVRQVSDLGCGDWQFSRYIDWSNVHYTGFDVVPRIIGDNKRNFSAPNIRFQIFESVDALPGGDLLLAKEILQHLPNEMVAEYLGAIRQKYKASLITNTVGPRGQGNGDTPIGGVRSLRVDEPPFSAPGATVLAYEFLVDGVLYQNETFLMIGLGSEASPEVR